jgi:hypothetical protein
MDDDYGFYCDLDNDSPLPRYMTKIKKIDDYYIVVDNYDNHIDTYCCDGCCDEVDVAKYINQYKRKSAERLLKTCVDISMACLFIGTSAYLVMHL